MTELEFEKAARGFSAPVLHEFPWGTSSTEEMRRVMPPNDDLALTANEEEASLSDDTRSVFGASYYWVLDLAGSVWERAVTIGHPVGRAFKGSHGDGRLTAYGSATNEDWPRGDETGGGWGIAAAATLNRVCAPASSTRTAPSPTDDLAHGVRHHGRWRMAFAPCARLPDARRCQRRLRIRSMSD